MDEVFQDTAFEYISEFVIGNDDERFFRQRIVMADNQSTSITQIDYTSIVIIMGSVFVVLFLLILITCAILRNSKRKYKFYQFQKREKQNREFEKEFFKPKASHWTVANSVKAYSIQSKEIYQNWKPPVFQLKSLPHFPHLYVVSSATNHPQCEGYVFYNNVRDSMGSSQSNISILNSSRAHQSIDMGDSNDRKTAALLEKKISTTVSLDENVEEFTKTNIEISITSPPPPSVGNVQASPSKILNQSASQSNIMQTVRNNFSSLSKGNLNSSTGTFVIADQNIVNLHMDELYRILQRNYFSYTEFVLYSPILIERSITSKDSELYFPANMTVRQYITDVVLSKYQNMTKNSEIYDIWMEYIETFERCKYCESCGKAKPTHNSLSESEFTIFLGHLHLLLNLRYKA